MCDTRTPSELVRLHDLTTLTRTHERTEAADGLAADPRRKVLRAQLLRPRRRPAGLPHRRAHQPVVSRRRRLDDVRILLGLRVRGRRAPDTEPLKELPRSLLARRERHDRNVVRGVGRGRRGGKGLGGANVFPAGVSVQVYTVELPPSLWAPPSNSVPKLGLSMREQA